MNIIEGNFQNVDGKYAIVVGRFNSFVVESLLQGALDTLKRHGVNDDNITVVRVPGAWELPLAAKKLAEKKHTMTPLSVWAPSFAAVRRISTLSPASAPGCWANR